MGDGLPEGEALVMCRLHRVGQGDRRLLHRRRVRAGRLRRAVRALLGRVRRPGRGPGLVGWRARELLRRSLVL
jgi:hypothetical protein